MSYTVSFVERRDPETSSIERVSRSLGSALSERGVNIRYDKLKYGNSLSGIVANTFATRPPPADIYHVTGHVHYYSLLLPPERTVLTIYDLQILRSRKGARRSLIKKLFYSWPVAKLKYIIVTSEHTKDELIHETGCPEDKIRVIECPLTTKPREDIRTFNANTPVILHIGTAPHKNLARLIRAIAGLRCRLAIIGRLDETDLQLLSEFNVKYENRLDLPDSGIRNEYLQADIVSFCSTSEGFGLPVIEAQALKIPVVTSNISPMTDVAGDGALFADPYDPASIRSAIERLIGSESLRTRIVEKGLENIRRFSPDRIASQYEELYRCIVELNRKNLR